MTIALSHKIDPAKSNGLWNCQSHARSPQDTGGHTGETVRDREDPRRS
jgi:hypothetical protein